MWIASSLDQAIKPAAIALGNFDGIHLGHQDVISSLPYPEGDSFYRTVLAFNPHPREFFSGQLQRLLTPIEERVHLLEDLGVEQLLLLPFDQELATLTPEEFMRQILFEVLQVTHISVGFNFHFGRDRSGTSQDLIAFGNANNIPVKILTAKTLDGDRISSSRIKDALEAGNIQLANQLLGRPYSLAGIVVKGQQIGRTIGFPTANLHAPAPKFLPRQGVYRVHVRAKGIPQTLDGVMNIGTRPTVQGQDASIEVHLFDWSGDLYGQTLVVSLAEFLRPEQKFNSLADLKQQIQRDCDIARSQLTPVA